LKSKKKNHCDFEKKSCGTFQTDLRTTRFLIFFTGIKNINRVFYTCSSGRKKLHVIFKKKTDYGGVPCGLWGIWGEYRGSWGDYFPN